MSATYPAGVVNIYGETLALSTTLASLGMVGQETKQAIIYNPNNDFRMHINPAMLAALFYDASATKGARYKNLSVVLQDRKATGSTTIMDSRAAGDRFYLCFSDIVGGVYVDIASVNGNASVLTVNYWNGAAWTDITDTDNTASGGASFAQDGTITWTAPTDWVAASYGGRNNQAISRVLGTAYAEDEPVTHGFWLQFVWTLTFDSDTEVANIWALNKNTNRGYFRGGVEYAMSFDRRLTGAIEAVLASSTDTLEITWLRTII